MVTVSPDRSRSGVFLLAGLGFKKTKRGAKPEINPLRQNKKPTVVGFLQSIS